MSTIAVRMAAGTPSVIALAGFSGQLANRNVDIAEMPKHTLRMFSSLGSVPLFPPQLVYQLGPLAFNNGLHFLRDMVGALDIDHLLMECLWIRRHPHSVAAPARCHSATP